MRKRHTLVRVTQIAVLIPATLVLACGALDGSAKFPKNESGLVHDINELREKSSLPPLEVSEILTKTALKRASIAASTGAFPPHADPLPGLIADGAYARFALLHEVQATDFRAAAQKILTDTLSKSKLLHPALTHIGIGAAMNGKTVMLAVDLAKLVPKYETKDAVAIIQQKLDEKRIRNSLELLSVNENLSTAAQNAASRFMSGEADSDKALEETQEALKTETFAFGRMTVSFQTAPDPTLVTIPERAADPALAFVGIGVAQGIHKDLEAGSVAVVLILAEPQTAHDSTRNLTDIPPPKAQLRSKPSADKPLSDQAWTATLTGNHRKAAELFEKAYRKTKTKSFMYEAARAHARNDNTAAALKDMRLYADMVSGEEKKHALDLVAKLEKGESIFSATAEDQMSVEAKRFFLMGRLLYEQKQWDGAVDAFQQAYKFSPTPEILYNIGLSHYRAGRIGEALNFFGEYQRLTPGAANIEEARQFFDIGVDLYKSGRFDAASLQFAMAYAFLPFPELVYNLGLCYKAMGENDKAIRFFREYLENELPEKDRNAVRAMIRGLSSGRKP